MYLAIVRPSEENERSQAEVMAIDEIDDLKEQDIVEFKDEKIKTKYPDQVQKILVEFEDVFPKELPRLPPTRTIDHRIELLPGSEPPHKAPYRMSSQALDELKIQLKDLMEKGYI